MMVQRGLEEAKIGMSDQVMVCYSMLSAHNMQKTHLLGRIKITRLELHHTLYFESLRIIWRALQGAHDKPTRKLVIALHDQILCFFYESGDGW